MKATLLNQKFYYEIRLQDFDDNIHTFTLETDKPIDVNNKASKREALLDYIVDVKWNCDDDPDGGRLSFLNECGEVGELYLYIDEIMYEHLHKTITHLITWQTLEEHISNRDLIEMILTLCFKDFK